MAVALGQHIRDNAAMVRLTFKIILAVFMIFVGVQHFINPAPFVRIVPDYLPWHLEIVYISGFFEALGGIGLLIPRLTRYAAWGLVALYVAVFPANLNMALHQLPFGDSPTPQWALWLRLPVQALLIWWAYCYTKWYPENLSRRPLDEKFPI